MRRFLVFPNSYPRFNSEDKYSDSVSRGKSLELENNSLRTQLATIKQTCASLQSKVNTLEAKIERQKDTGDSAKSNINTSKPETSEARSNQSRVSFHSNVIDDISTQTKSLMTFDLNRNSPGRLDFRVLVVINRG